jgi:hypothetical protein
VRGKPHGQWIWHSRFADPPPGFAEGERPAQFSADSDAWQASAGSRLISLEHQYGRGVFHFYQGLPDSRWEWFDPEGKRYLLLQFDRGQLLSGDLDKLDPRLADLLQTRGIDNPRHVVMLLRPCN